MQQEANVCGNVSVSQNGMHVLWSGEGLSEEAVAASTQALATAVLDQGGISEDASLMRAAAQMYACAACIGTNAVATQLIQSVCKDMAQTPVPARLFPPTDKTGHLKPL